MATDIRKDCYTKAWHRGNFAEAYEGHARASEAWAHSRGIPGAPRDPGDSGPDALQLRATIMAGFVLGFYASYELAEVPTPDRYLYLVSLRWATELGLESEQEVSREEQLCIACLGPLVWLHLAEAYTS